MFSNDIRTNRSFAYLVLKAITWDEMVKMDIQALYSFFSHDMNYYVLCGWKNGIITLDHLKTMDCQDVYDIFSLQRNAFESIMMGQMTLKEHLAMRKRNLIKWSSQYHKPSSTQFKNWANMVHYSNFLQVIPLAEL